MACLFRGALKLLCFKTGYLCMKLLHFSLISLGIIFVLLDKICVGLLPLLVVARHCRELLTHVFCLNLHLMILIDLCLQLILYLLDICISSLLLSQVLLVLILLYQLLIGSLPLLIVAFHFIDLFAQVCCLIENCRIRGSILCHSSSFIFDLFGVLKIERVHLLLELLIG